MSTPDPSPGTVAGLLRARSEDQSPGLRFQDRVWSWSEVVALSAARGRWARSTAGPGKLHIGVLLDNLPEYLFWLGGAALAGATVVGINPTRRGEELARDIRFTDCDLIVTDDAGSVLLRHLDLGVAPGAVIVVGDGLDRGPGEADASDPGLGSPPKAGDLYLLLFTSGTTGSPKAVRCTQGRLALIAQRAAAGYDFRADDVCYCPMPLFHGNAVMALWAPALFVGASLALAGRFSASRFIDDVRHYGATRFTYVGKALSYVLATPARPDDADNKLRLGFGTEASEPDRRSFEARFGCRLVEGYGSSEGGIAIQVGPDTPAGSLGRPNPGDDVAVCNPETGDECPPGRFDAGGQLLNGAEAIGEIVNRKGATGFEGYYANGPADQQRTRRGWYWSGDLAYRDADGWLYFAGRGGDWLRVDSENFAAGPIERILERHPDVAAAAVYPVPDPRTGDRVMAALELRGGARFEPVGFRRWLDDQPDLGTKWAPELVRVTTAMPLTATGKVTKAGLRGQAWVCDEPVWVADGRRRRYRLLDDRGRSQLQRQLAEHGRSHLLGATS